MPEGSEPAPRPSFSKINPNLQLAWDSTSLDALKRCPQYYKYSIIDGYFRGDNSADIIFGQLFHSATETYDHSIAQGASHDDAIIDALESTINRAWDTETQSFPFRYSLDTAKNLETLLRAIVWYLDHFEHDHLKTVILSNGKPAVELSFQINLDTEFAGDEGAFEAYTGETYILCGHLDKVIEWLDELRFKDTKTTRRNLDQKYFDQFNPNTQFTVYSIAMHIIFHEDRPIGGALVDAIQTQVNGNRFRRQQISISHGQMEEFLTDLTILLREAETYARMNHWPKRESACNMYSGCQYRDVCSHDPAARSLILENFYSRRKLWEPIEPR